MKLINENNLVYLKNLNDVNALQITSYYFFYVKLNAIF